MKTQWTRMTADEVEIIQHNDMVAFSGFTPAGSPKALPTAIARRANEQHEAKKPYQIRLLTGASISAAADEMYFLTPMLFPACAISNIVRFTQKDQSGRGEFR